MLAFVLAQAGAQVHAYAHLASDPAGSAPATQGQGCTECLSFASVVHAAGGADTLLVLLPRDVRWPMPAAAGHRVERFHSHCFRSRAPPVLH